jgi:2-polyprenyl-6-methoxyphenol hydroxylase-like FAD-dependent oxidoreductase
MAFDGDAAQAPDPLFGVGCGWAFQSADWLDEEVGPALHGSARELNRALGAYARRHRREPGAHNWLISDYSSGRHFSPLDKLVYSTAARDAELAGRVEDFGTPLDRRHRRHPADDHPGPPGAARAGRPAASARLNNPLFLERF